MKRSKNDDSRGKVLDLWQAPEGAGDPLVCVSTTFTFDATFFETECLGRFLRMDTHPQESERVGYLIEREEKLAATRVCVLVDRRHATDKESLRWDVLPILVSGAALHAKLSVLCWADQVRVIIGSGNLTVPGYRKNLEVFGSFDVFRERGGPVELVRQTIEFLNDIVGYSPGDEARPGPKRRARETLDLIRHHVRRWPNVDPRGPRVFPLFGGPGRPLFEQIQQTWPSSTPPRYADVLSPFFDENAPLVVEALVGVMAKRRPRQLDVYVTFEDLPDGRTRLLAPRNLVMAARQQCDTLVWKISSEQEQEIRPLHAKMLSLMGDAWELRLIGSSNFTRAGFGVGRSSVNFEANLAYLTRVDSTEFGRLNTVWPDYLDEEVDSDSPSLVWEPTFATDGEGEAVVPLPAGFREALFDAGSTPPLLVLSLGGKLPQRWSIKTPENVELLRSDTWPGEQGEYVVDWGGRLVPFVLSVSWEVGACSYTASWPVNVVEPAALPPPSELRGLSLEELIEILGSTRPLHEAVVRVLRNRSRKSAIDVQLDPHKRVNTETFLLRRTKRVALALERLRERLERPVLTVDALDWRLRGPVGPLALAEAFRKDARTPGEARFCLAELALALKRVRVRHAALGGLSAQVIRERILTCIDDVERVAVSFECENGSAIDRYVSEAFAEARR